MKLMDTGAVIGMLAGIFGLAIGIFAALLGLGCFEYLGGKRPSSVPPVAKQELLRRLLALNDPAKPYQIVPAEDCDLKAEWKIADATWYGIFNKNGLKRTYTAHLLVDEERHSVRCFEQLRGLSWSVGSGGFTPQVSVQTSFFAGRFLTFKSWGKGYGFQRPTPSSAGKVYEYRFDIDEIRGPIADVVQECGWEWVPVTARRHATIRNEMVQA